MFKLIKNLHQTFQAEEVETVSESDDIDDETDEDPPELKSLRIKIMISTLLEPSASSHLYEIRRILTAITDQIQAVKVAKWKDLEPTKNNKPVWNNLPSTPQNAEQFIMGFHANINQPKGYYRLHLLYPADLHLETFQYVFETINVPQKQSVSIAPDNVVYPTVVGFIKGSTEAMMRSPDLVQLIKKSTYDFGFEWKFIQTGIGGKFNRNQKAIFVETNANTAPLMKDFLKTFITKYNPVFGAHLGFQPISKYGNNTQLAQVKQYAPIQCKLVAALMDLDVEIGNFAGIQDPLTNTKSTLIEALLNLTSIVQKKSIKKGNDFVFDGKVFYSAITN